MIYKKDIKELKQFIREVHLKKSITSNESTKNLEEGLIEIIYPYGQHKGNGILLTENGYFLSAKHCFEKKLNNQRIRTFNKRVYKLEEICLEDDSNDLVLAKAKIKDKPVIRDYRFYNTDNLEKMAILLLTIKKGQINREYGLIIRDWNLSPNKNGKYYVDNFSIIPAIDFGGSGGIIISPSLEIIGIAEGGNEVYGSCIKINKAIDLIYQYIRKIENL